MKLVIDSIRLDPSNRDDNLLKYLEKNFNIFSTSFKGILKKSIDARNKNSIKVQYRVLVEVDEENSHRLLSFQNISIFKPIKEQSLKLFQKNKTFYITGTGPAGLFCALRLIEYGASVHLFEKGKKVENRINDIQILERTGHLNENSNILFGEGGAGMYSDGKLTTRINKPEITWFYKQLEMFKAPESIFYLSKPHIGSDKLMSILKKIRNYIVSKGSKISFQEEIIDLVFKENKLHSIRSNNNEYNTDNLVLAIGHSARDTYSLLYSKGMALEKKIFAAGVRIEHPQELINSIQYGDSKHMHCLPNAEYQVAFNNKKTGKGIYSFCMCPGGVIVNSSSEQGHLCVNGMSFFNRDKEFANSAIVVTVHPEDTGNDIFSGIEFQRNLEKSAFQAGKESFCAPIQTVDSFFKNKVDSHLIRSSYKPAVINTNFNDLLPKWICDEIKLGLQNFNRKMIGFTSKEAHFVGVETRTSSPIRIVRDDGFESISHEGVFPIGEGAGYAGGIVSSAVDGIRLADRLIEKYN